MTQEDSMFLVEMVVEELRSCVKCKDFIIKNQFADIFSITLKDPKDSESRKYPHKKCNKRKAVRFGPGLLYKKPTPVPKEQSGQSILISSTVDNLIANMKKYGMELSLWSKVYPQYRLASTIIPWSSKFIDYLYGFPTRKTYQSAIVNGEYNVFDDFTSRRMAVIRLKIKLSCTEDNVKSSLRSLSEKNQDLSMDTSLNSANTTSSSSVQKISNWAQDTGVIKTIYSGGLKKYNDKEKIKCFVNDNVIKNNSTVLCESQFLIKTIENISKTKVNNSIISLVKSVTDVDKVREIDIIKSKSCSSINKDHLNILNYIFGDSEGHFGNQVYFVNYCTVQNDAVATPASSKTTLKSEKTSNRSSIPSSSQLTTPKSPPIKSDPDRSSVKDERYKSEMCDTSCLLKKGSVLSFDLPKQVEKFAKVNTCKDLTCEHKEYRKLPTPPDQRILLDLTNLKKKCCTEGVGEKLEEVVGGMKAKIKIGETDPCYCECECRFGFTKRTQYCTTCGGYEVMGEDLEKTLQVDMPFPCPIYHKLTEKPKSKIVSLTGSDFKRGTKTKSLAEKSKSNESEKETKKGKKKKKSDKFKFNYGYTAPKIGHGHCAFPCTGTLGQVPKNMGWLWTADNIPGMKFRPLWKPGAVNKHVLRLLKIARNPEEAFAKKKRKKDTGKAKRPLKRPLLIVHKKDGEYTVTMETMKTYSKPRTINQVPYEDKPIVTYTVGRTEEENRERRKKKERSHRRLERAQREFIQSAFRDMCQEICLKTYQQALGILPDAEKPDCSCYPAEPGADRTDLDRSCSCSDDSNLTGSDTDSDEWIVEFTPPSAAFDPTYKTKKVAVVDNESQYTYLDYRVKLLDRFGNPVPRFFKGPDGKQQCSDLGGFWDAEHKWLDINVDGYIGPDERWAPNVFLGPNGEQVDGELGKFQAMDGTWLVVGIDGYVDNGKWRYYHKSVSPIKVKNSKPERGKRAVAHRIDEKKSYATWSCFGDTSAKYLSEMGIMGHGHDRKLLLDTLKNLMAQGENVKLPKSTNVPRFTHSKKSNKHQTRLKCKHAKPSAKAIIAVDELGRKTYFKLKSHKNTRSKQRIDNLTEQGISVTSYHLPCFHSFISTEIMKKQLYDRQVALAQQRENRGQPAHQMDTRINNKDQLIIMNVEPNCMPMKRRPKSAKLETAGERGSSSHYTRIVKRIPQ